ncbi:MAG: hypothetical protein ABI999_11020 [Acidobacteriota bacterium]
MERKWTEFEVGPRRAAEKGLYVSLNKEGDLLISGARYEALKGQDAVVLLFDSTTWTIGLRPASYDLPNAYPIIKKGNHGNKQVCIRPFMRKHEMRVEHGMRFMTAAIEDRVLVLEMRRTTDVSRARTVRKR